MRFFAFCAATLACLSPIAAQAEEEEEEFFIPGDFCGQAAIDMAAPLAGKWEAVNREGAGTVGSRYFPLKDKPKEKLELENSGNGTLRFKGDGQELDMAPQNFGQNLPDEFNFEIDGEVETIDVREYLPCDWAQMPGYVGTLDYPFPAGMGAMQMKVILNFPSAEMGMGALHFTGNMQGREINVLRYVTLTRR